MINQEMIANPVLEELSEEPTQSDNYSDETFLKAKPRKFPRAGSQSLRRVRCRQLFNQYLTVAVTAANRRREVSERPSFEKFLSLPAASPSIRLAVSVTICSESVKGSPKASSAIR
jgi:hypothetical protein